MREWHLLAIGQRYACVSLVEMLPTSNEHHSVFIIFERKPLGTTMLRANRSNSSSAANFRWVQTYCVRFERSLTDNSSATLTSNDFPSSSGAANVAGGGGMAFSAIVAGGTDWLDALDGCTDFGMLFGGLWYDFGREVWLLRRYAWRELDQASSAAQSNSE
jgi:hypothetical protein